MKQGKSKKVKHRELYYKKEETGQLLILDGTYKAVIPINDYYCKITRGVTKQEKLERCKVASLCRLMDHLGYCENQDLELPTTISLRMKENTNLFLVNPANVMPEEVEASLVIKTDIRAEHITIDNSLGMHQDFDEDAFLPHSLIYYYREDIKCIIGVFNSDVVNISTNGKGILPLCRSAAILGKVKHHKLTTDLDDSDECERLAKDTLGKDSKVVLVSKVGAFCCGGTVEEAFYYVENLFRAVEYQKNTVLFGDKILLGETEQEKIFTKSKLPVYKLNGEEYSIGEMSYEYHMRELDVRGYLTGYEYKHRWSSPLFTILDETADNFNETVEETIYDPDKAFDPTISGEWQDSSHLHNNSNCHSMGNLHVPETIDEEQSNEIEKEETPAVVIENVDVVEAVQTLESSPDNIQPTDGEIGDSKELPVAKEANNLDSTQEIEVESASDQDAANEESDAIQNDVKELQEAENVDQTTENNIISEEPSKSDNEVQQNDEPLVEKQDLDEIEVICEQQTQENDEKPHEIQETIDDKVQEPQESPSSEQTLEIQDPLNSDKDDQPIVNDEKLESNVPTELEELKSADEDINGENDACEADLTFEAFEEDIKQTETLESVSHLYDSDAELQLNDSSDGSSKTNLFIEILSAEQDKKRIEGPKENQNLPENPQNDYEIVEQIIKFDENENESQKVSKVTEEIEQVKNDQKEFDEVHSETINLAANEEEKIEIIENESTQADGHESIESSAENSGETQNNGQMSEEDKLKLQQLEILDRDLNRIKEGVIDGTPAKVFEVPPESQRKPQKNLPDENSALDVTHDMKQLEDMEEIGNLEKNIVKEVFGHDISLQIQNEEQICDEKMPNLIENIASEEIEPIFPINKIDKIVNSNRQKLRKSPPLPRKIGLTKKSRTSTTPKTPGHVRFILPLQNDTKTSTPNNPTSTEEITEDCEFHTAIDITLNDSNDVAAQKISMRPSFARNFSTESDQDACVIINDRRMEEELFDVVEAEVLEEETLAAMSNLFASTENLEELVKNVENSAEKQVDADNVLDKSVEIVSEQEVPQNVGEKLVVDPEMEKDIQECISEAVKNLNKEKLLENLPERDEIDTETVNNDANDGNPTDDDENIVTWANQLALSKIETDPVNEDEKLNESLKLAAINAQINESISSSILECNSDDEDIDQLEKDQLNVLESSSRVSSDSTPFFSALGDDIDGNNKREIGTQTEIAGVDFEFDDPKLVCFKNVQSVKKFFEETQHAFEASELVLNDNKKKISEETQTTTATITQSIQVSPKEAPKEIAKPHSVKMYRTNAFYGYNLPMKAQTPNNFAQTNLKRYETIPNINKRYDPIITISKLKSMISEEAEVCTHNPNPKDIVCCLCKISTAEKVKRNLFNNPDVVPNCTADSGVESDHMSTSIAFPKTIRSTSLLARIQEYEEEVKRKTINAVLLKTPPKRPHPNSEALCHSV